MSSTSPRTSGRVELPPTTTNRSHERERERERNDRNEERPERAERSERSDREWKSNREPPSGGLHQHRGNGGANGGLNGSAPSGSALVDGSNSTVSTPVPPASNSLRSRISDFSAPAGSNRGHSNLRVHDEAGDVRKRSATERERDSLSDIPLSGGSAPPNSSSSSAASKRLRINRTRYQDNAISQVLSSGHTSGRSHGGGGGSSGK